MEGLSGDRAAGVEARGTGPRRGGSLNAPGHVPAARRRIVIWRHGRTLWNLQNRFQGQTDVPLDKTGRAQARRAARLLAALRPDAILASDLRRAADTASALARVAGLEIVFDKDLRESYAGVWQGLTNDEIVARFPQEMTAWRRGEPVRRGGGELESEVAERAVAALERGLEPVGHDGTLVAVTHGGAARVAIGRLLGLPGESWGALGGLSNCCWSVLGETGQRWRLLEHNAGTLPEPVLGDDQ